MCDAGFYLIFIIHFPFKTSLLVNMCKLKESMQGTAVEYNIYVVRMRPLHRPPYSLSGSING